MWGPGAGQQVDAEGHGPGEAGQEFVGQVNVVAPSPIEGCILR